MKSIPTSDAAASSARASGERSSAPLAAPIQAMGVTAMRLFTIGTP
jgi:hypothetical protein